jgi:hypothetical protein
VRDGGGESQTYVVVDSFMSSLVNGWCRPGMGIIGIMMLAVAIVGGRLLRWRLVEITLAICGSLYFVPSSEEDGDLKMRRTELLE